MLLVIGLILRTSFVDNFRKFIDNLKKTLARMFPLNFNLDLSGRAYIHSSWALTASNITKTTLQILTATS